MARTVTTTLERQADPTLRTKCFEGPGPNGKDPRASNPLLSRLVTCQNITKPLFVEQLKGPLFGLYLNNEAVADSSQLTDAYNFTLSFTGTPGSAADSATARERVEALDPDGAVTLFAALEHQLGLKLEKRSVPAAVVVIDHIEQRPTEN